MKGSGDLSSPVAAPRAGYSVAPVQAGSRVLEGCDRDGVTSAWIESLPSQVENAASQWSLHVGPAYLPGGYRGWAAPCTLPDGTGAVLKCVPSGWEVPQVHAMQTNRGRFLPALYAWAPGAILMERLDAVSLASRPDDIQLGAVPEIIGQVRTLACVQTCASYDSLMSGCVKSIEQDSGNAPSDVRSAWETWKRLPQPDDEHFPLHGDLHEEHIFMSSPIRGIDPNPMLGPLAWDLEPLTRRYTDRRDPRGLARLLDVLGEEGISRASVLFHASLRAHYYYSLAHGDRWRIRIAGLSNVVIHP